MVGLSAIKFFDRKFRFTENGAVMEDDIEHAPSPLCIWSALVRCANTRPAPLRTVAQGRPRDRSEEQRERDPGFGYRFRKNRARCQRDPGWGGTEGYRRCRPDRHARAG